MVPRTPERGGRSAPDAEGKSPFEGYRITGYADEEEEPVGLAAKAKWLMEDEVTDKVGVEYSRGPIWQPYTVVDRDPFTGQNPASAGPLAREHVLPALA